MRSLESEVPPEPTPASMVGEPRTEVGVTDRDDFWMVFALVIAALFVGVMVGFNTPHPR